MKNIEKEIIKVKEKLGETENKLKNNNLSIESYENKLAECLALDMVSPERKVKNAIDTISEKLKKIRDETDLLPKVVLALKKKLKDLEERKRSLILESKIEKQKAIGAELAKISGSFIKNLKLSIKQNAEILSLWVGWNKLKEETNFDQFEKKVSLGSQEMLGIVAGILIGEFERNALRKQNVFNRIRL